MYANEQVYPSLALETLRALYDMGSYQTKVTEEVGIEWVRMGKAILKQHRQVML